MINPMVAALRGPRSTILLATISLSGLDLTGASFRLQVREYGDQPGSPWASLSTVTSASAEGVRLIGVANNVSTMGVRFNKSTMAAMPAAPEPGGALTGRWDLLITPQGGVEERYVIGDFIVEPGVTL